MALALGEALLQDPALADPAAVMNRWLNWYHHGLYSHNGKCFDIGNQTAAALTAWAHSQALPAHDTNAAGNGSIMRLAPVAIAGFKNPARMREIAQRQSDFTHRNAACRATAAGLADLIAACIAGDDAAIASQIPPGIAARPAHDIESTGYVIHTFEAALWAFAPQDGFESIVLRAVNLGDDADTVGAVAGQIAGARYGLSGIPAPWLQALAWRDDIIAMARALYGLAV